MISTLRNAANPTNTEPLQCQTALGGTYLKHLLTDGHFHPHFRAERVHRRSRLHALRHHPHAGRDGVQVLRRSGSRLQTKKKEGKAKSSATDERFNFLDTTSKRHPRGEATVGYHVLLCLFSLPLENRAIFSATDLLPVRLTRTAGGDEIPSLAMWGGTR